MKCKECGNEFGGNAKFCPECGESVLSDNRGRKNRKEDDDEEGGILGGLGDIVGKIFGG